MGWIYVICSDPRIEVVSLSEYSLFDLLGLEA